MEYHYAIPGWRKMQHYHNRRPPWIKLHRDTLDNPAIITLAPRLQGAIFMFWIIASEDPKGLGRIPDLKTLRFRLRREDLTSEDMKSLIKQGLIGDASTMLADCLQEASAEGEGEGEGETEGEKSKDDVDASAPTAPPTVKKFIYPTIEEVTAYCQERGKGVDPHLWFDHYTSNGWKVGKNSMKDWKAAVRTWERNAHNTPRKPDLGENHFLKIAQREALKNGQDGNSETPDTF